MANLNFFGQPSNCWPLRNWSWQNHLNWYLNFSRGFYTTCFFELKKIGNPSFLCFFAATQRELTVLLVTPKLVAASEIILLRGLSLLLCASKNWTMLFLSSFVKLGFFPTIYDFCMKIRTSRSEFNANSSVFIYALNFLNDFGVWWKAFVIWNILRVFILICNFQFSAFYFWRKFETIFVFSDLVGSFPQL